MAVDSLRKLTKKSLRELKGSITDKNIQDGKNKKYRITVHMGTCGIASGAEEIKHAVAEEIKERDKKEIIFDTSGCVGFCSREPMLTIDNSATGYVTYHSLDVNKVKKIFDIHIDKGELVEELAPITTSSKLSDFYKYQELRVLRNKGKINPFKITDYITQNGYEGLLKAIEFDDPEEIIRIVSESGLRGRGGAGFPTGKKWEFCRRENSSNGIKYIVCNGDEGDPGAFMDRNLLESDPHSVLEGMLIAAVAIGSNKGYVYVRAEYPLAVKTLASAIDQAKEYGLIGKNVLGSGFDFDIELYRGAGAFVCGEETALLHSIEGKRGMPRNKPPFPASEVTFSLKTDPDIMLVF